MRWTVVLLALAACSRWTTYVNGDDLRPELAEALRTEEGGASLVAGGRAYAIGPHALREERRAFTAVLADALETQRYRVTGVAAVGFADINVSGVTSYHYPDRRIELAGAVTVQGMRRGSSSLYWVSLRKREHYYLYVDVMGTPAIDRAWQRLARRAEATAEPAIHTPAPLETMHADTDFTRAALIDLDEPSGSD
jgi:hypothetical protein